MALKYKVGDRVKIKSLDWYNENKDTDGFVHCHPYTFVAIMSQYCGTIFTINSIDNFDKKYKMTEDGYHFDWTDEMIEGLVEEPVTLNGKEVLLKLADIELPSGTTNIWECPKGYQFVDENGNVINATKIVLEKKKKEYPKTYEECSLINGAEDRISLSIIGKFTKLINARNAYWKIAGEEMGLGKPWKPDYNEESYEQGSPIKYVIYYTGTSITKERKCTSYVLSFPTEEMRDAFKENFKELIEQCKELL